METDFNVRLDLVPMEPGVYLMKDASGSVIYVGKAKKLRNRLKSYFASGEITNPKVRAMVSHIADFEYIVVTTEVEAFLLESNLIKRYMPQYNILLRDDKGYPYICVTLNEEYPRVFKSFRVDKALKSKGAVYYGPYLAGDLARVLEIINNVFPLRKCNRKLPQDIGKERPCLNSHIGNCLAPCSGKISAEEYRQMINDVIKLLNGNIKNIEDKLKSKMLEYSSSNEFEKAAKVRDKIYSLNEIFKTQTVFLDVDRDVDAIGLYSEAGEICIRKLELRGGRVTGSSTFFVKGNEEDKGEVLAGFFMQYYSDINAERVPGTIIIRDLTVLSDDNSQNDIEEFLTDLAGKKVKLHEPSRGELLRLIKLAELNAREMMVRRVLRGGNKNADSNLPIRKLEEIFEVETGRIKRIESYDISNLGNDDICSGMVVYEDGKPNKKEYRLFKMKSVKFQDDFASMSEVLSRRFQHNEKDGFKFPDLILVDGGKGQLKYVEDVLKKLDIKDVLLAGMVKNKMHKTSALLLTDGRKFELLQNCKSNVSNNKSFNKSSQNVASSASDTVEKLGGKFADEKILDDESRIILLRFLSGVQNEVHRFSVNYQRKLSHKRNIHYKLEEIDGIGPKKRQNLLKKFKSLKELSEASVEEIAKTEGISQKDAINVYNYFN